MVSNQIDPITAAVAIVSVLISPTLAIYVGPYAMIVLSTTVGASWALRRHGVKYTGWQKLWYFSLLNGTAIIITVGAANAVGHMLKVSEDYRYLLISPIALVVGGVGNDWPKLLKWFPTVLMRIFERRVGVDGDKDANK